jgi:hypothetical protein
MVLLNAISSYKVFSCWQKMMVHGYSPQAEEKMNKLLDDYPQ